MPLVLNYRKLPKYLMDMPIVVFRKGTYIVVKKYIQFFFTTPLSIALRALFLPPSLNRFHYM